MNAKILLPVSLTAALLAACSTSQDLETLRETTPQGSEFNQRLAADYEKFASFEAFDMGDWTDQEYFAQKGLRAAQGELVLPEEVSYWASRFTLGPGFEEGQIPAAEQQRERLLAALNGGGRDLVPAAAARAQVNYDCWLEQMEEGWQEEHIQSCRDSFEQAMAELEEQLAAARAAQAQPAPPPEPAPAPAPEPEPAIPSNYLVFFEFDSAQISPDARDIIRTAANNARGGEPVRLVVIGHADRSGPAAYNLGLSERRAEAVREVLVGLGVAQGDISVRAQGETEPLVPTPDGVREPQNRRVEILLQ